MPAGAAPQAQDPSQGQDPSQSQGQDGSGLGDVGQLINGIHNQMLELGQLLEQAKLPPQDAQALGAAVQAFQKFVQGLMQDAQGAGGQDQGGAQGPAPQPMEQGKAAVKPANF